jgi:serine/threonine protein kinase
MPPIRPAQLPPRYEPLGELGRGGMGIVYKARDRETGEVLAIKVLKSDIATDTQILDRFKNELRLARQITHRNVARLYEFHRAGESVYLSMEFVEGESLRALLQRAGKLPFDQAISLARQLADGLGEAHRQSIVHRDLKPENIMVGPGGQLKVMDFGISRSFAADVTATGAIIGTPAYMAPEQAEGRPVDHRTDIYAYGLVLYEMFTGAAAFTGDTAITLAMKQIRERPKAPRSVDPTLPKHVEAAILRCLEKDPSTRFQSVEDAVRALESAPSRPARRAKSPLPRKALLGVAALALAAVLVVWWWRWRETDSFTLPIETFTLSNGLHVALSPDHSSPTVTAVVAYRSGTRYEQPGHIGLAHLVEHMMFQGSENVGRGEHMALVSDAGGLANGQSVADLSLFWDNLPANQLDLALFLEADRMRGLAMTPEGLATARAAIAEERATALANPFMRARIAITPLSFDAFPNQRTVFTADAPPDATLDDAVAYYRAHYTPGTAGLVIVGDFDPAKARELVHQRFDAIPKRDAAPEPDLREPGRAAERRDVRSDPGLQTPVLLISWRVPAATDPDWFAVKRLGEALGGNDAARLQTTLVNNTGLAGGVLVNLENSNGPNLLTAQVTMAAGKDPAAAERAIYDEIDRIAKDGIPAAELDTLATDARRRRAFQLVTTVARGALMAQFLTSFGKLDAINEWERMESTVSSDTVRQMARKYFAPSGRTVLLVNPGGRP